MLEFMNEIPDLTGKVCESFVKQKFWHNGEQTEGVNVLYLKIENEKWHRFFFDCGVLFWKEVDAPDIWNTTSADEYHYPQIEIGQEKGLNYVVIEGIKAIDAGEWPELYIAFSNGISLVLRDFCEYQLLDFRQNDRD